MSALRRNFFSQIDLELRTVEHTLTYIESALKQVPCDRVFIAHYEHALANPGELQDDIYFSCSCCLLFYITYTDHHLSSSYAFIACTVGDFIEPLSEFLELGSRQKQALEQRMKKTGKKPSRKVSSF